MRVSFINVNSILRKNVVTVRKILYTTSLKSNLKIDYQIVRKALALTM